MTIYLDHAASSPATRDVLDYYRDVSFRHAVNPSSNHQAGKDAQAALAAAKQTVLACFGASKATLITTSGGTEAINQALLAYETPRRFTPHLVISAGEHKAVSVVATHLEKQGRRVSVMPLNRAGAPDFSAFPLDPDHLPTCLSVILLSNETGAITDIEGLVAWRNKHCPDAVIHVDAVQAAGKMAIDFDAWGIDFLSVSGHKWGAPMGVGFLLAKSVTHLAPLIRGAGQQSGLRAGSENVPLVAATAYALQQATAQLPDNLANVTALKAKFLSLLAERNIEYRLISPAAAAPFIVTIAFPLMGETLARVLSDHGIFVGRGAACSGGKASQNSALTACGVDDLTVQRAVRISFGKTNTDKDMVALVDRIEATLAQFKTK